MYFSDLRAPAFRTQTQTKPQPNMHTTHNPSSITRNLAAEMHAFSSKERDTETGLSYFGARYYSSDLSLWLSVDPMAGKYPSLSPYVYCANKPVKLVDPNGEEIVIEWKGSVYQYEHDGSLTLVKGLALNDRQLNRFVGKAQKSLNRINKTTEGNRMIVDLQDSEMQYTIKSGASGYEKEEANTITWNSNGTRVPVQGTPFGEINATIDLAHELSHAFDDECGWSDQSPSIDDIGKNEWVACYRENIIRKELGLAFRTNYKVEYSEDGHFIGGKGSSLIKDGKPYLPFDIQSYEY